MGWVWGWVRAARHQGRRPLSGGERPPRRTLEHDSGAAPGNEWSGAAGERCWCVKPQGAPESAEEWTWLCVWTPSLSLILGECCGVLGGSTSGRDPGLGKRHSVQLVSPPTRLLTVDG